MIKALLLLSFITAIPGVMTANVGNRSIPHHPDTLQVQYHDPYLQEPMPANAPEWITLNMRLSYLILKGLRIHATLENLTDLRYRPYSSGISAPGRNITFSLTYNL